MKKEEERKGLELKTSVPLCIAIAIASKRKTRSFLILLAIIHYICILSNLVVGNLCIKFM